MMVVPALGRADAGSPTYHHARLGSMIGGSTRVGFTSEGESAEASGRAGQGQRVRHTRGVPGRRPHADDEAVVVLESRAADVGRGDRRARRVPRGDRRGAGRVAVRRVRALRAGRAGDRAAVAPIRNWMDGEHNLGCAGRGAREKQRVGDVPRLVDERAGAERVDVGGPVEGRVDRRPEGERRGSRDPVLGRVGRADAGVVRPVVAARS